MEGKWKVAFLCKNNTCRSQIAEALAKRLASDVMDVYSAGVELGKEMHDCAVRMLKETHGIDLVEEGYHTKLISDIPDVDIIIYMGCNVECVSMPCQIELDWGLLDPCGGTDENFKKTIKIIENNILSLRDDIISGRINQWKKENLTVDFAPAFPFWNELTKDQQERIDRGWRIELFDKGRQVYDTTQGCKGVMLVRKGSLRIYMVSEEGREVTLYRLFQGDVCVLSAACLMEELDFDILIEAPEDSEVVTIPAADLQSIMKENALMETYLYKKTAERFSNVMWTIQQILFKKIDQRIARYLWDVMSRDNTTKITATHDEIARDIGSAREVVTKTMKHMAGDGLIKSGHGKVEILDKDGLYALL